MLDKDKGTSHDRSEDSFAAKVRWFKTLTEGERLAWLDVEYEKALKKDPDIVKRKPVNSLTGRVVVLSLSEE